jgi:hypothetical protein
MTLLELADRVEAATGDGSDRELERDIAYATGWTFERNKDGCDDDDYGFLGDPYIWIDPTGAPADGFPDYLTSLDAAMTLVPDGMVYAITNCDPTLGTEPDFSKSAAIVGHPDDIGEPRIAATPALALAAASLRAMALDGGIE